MAESAPLEILAAKRRVSDTVADLILNRIVNGEYAEGDHLPSEKEMMLEFDVGRVSVREAIASLRWKGFLVVKQGERPRITRPEPQIVIEQISYVARAILGTPSGVGQFNQARLIFEQGVVQFVVANATDEEIARVSAVQKSNEQLLSDPRAFIDGDVSFHRELVNLTKNPILISSHMALVEWLIMDRLRRSQKNPLQTHEEHAAILSAIEDRNLEQAMNAVKEHLDRTIEPSGEYDSLS